jgi:UDP-2,3-diacylglucosamine pyrophosphatase LpxH
MSTETMRIYIFDEIAYKLTENQYKELKKKEIFFEANESRADFYEYLQSKKTQYKLIGLIDGHFHL